MTNYTQNLHLIELECAFSLDICRESLFIKAKQRNSFDSNFFPNSVLALSSFLNQGTSQVISLKNSQYCPLSRDFRVLSYSSNTTYFRHGEHIISLFDYICFDRKKNIKNI